MAHRSSSFLVHTFLLLTSFYNSFAAQGGWIPWPHGVVTTPQIAFFPQPPAYPPSLPPMPVQSPYSYASNHLPPYFVHPDPSVVQYGPRLLPPGSAFSSNSQPLMPMPMHNGAYGVQPPMLSAGYTVGYCVQETGAHQQTFAEIWDGCQPETNEPETISKPLSPEAPSFISDQEKQKQEAEKQAAQKKIEKLEKELAKLKNKSAEQSRSSSDPKPLAQPESVPDSWASKVKGQKQPTSTSTPKSVATHTTEQHSKTPAAAAENNHPTPENGHKTPSKKRQNGKSAPQEMSDDQKTQQELKRAAREKAQQKEKSDRKTAEEARILAAKKAQAEYERAAREATERALQSRPLIFEDGPQTSEQRAAELARLARLKKNKQGGEKTTVQEKRPHSTKKKKEKGSSSKEGKDPQKSAEENELLEKAIREAQQEAPLAQQATTETSRLTRKERRKILENAALRAQHARGCKNGITAQLVIAGADTQQPPSLIQQQYPKKIDEIGPELLAAGNYEEAYQHFWNLSSRGSKDALLGMARALRGLNRVQEAEKVLQIINPQELIESNLPHYTSEQMFVEITKPEVDSKKMLEYIELLKKQGELDSAYCGETALIERCLHPHWPECKIVGPHDGSNCSHEALFQAASQSNFPHCRAIQGALLLQGMGVKCDVEKGLKLLQDADKLGEFIAPLYLGEYSYCQGEIEKAEEYFRRAAKAGTLTAQRKLVEFCLKEPGPDLERLKGLLGYYLCFRQSCNSNSDEIAPLAQLIITMSAQTAATVDELLKDPSKNEDQLKAWWYLRKSAEKTLETCKLQGTMLHELEIGSVSSDRIAQIFPETSDKSNPEATAQSPYTYIVMDNKGDIEKFLQHAELFINKHREEYNTSKNPTQLVFVAEWLSKIAARYEIEGALEKAKDYYDQLQETLDTLSEEARKIENKELGAQAATRRAHSYLSECSAREFGPCGTEQCPHARAIEVLKLHRTQPIVACALAEIYCPEEGSGCPCQNKRKEANELLTIFNGQDGCTDPTLTDRTLINRTKAHLLLRSRSVKEQETGILVLQTLALKGDEISQCDLVAEFLRRSLKKDSFNDLQEALAWSRGTQLRPEELILPRFSHDQIGSLLGVLEKELGTIHEKETEDSLKKPLDTLTRFCGFFGSTLDNERLNALTDMLERFSEKLGSNQFIKDNIHAAETCLAQTRVNTHLEEIMRQIRTGRFEKLPLLNACERDLMARTMPCDPPSPESAAVTMGRFMLQAMLTNDLQHFEEAVKAFSETHNIKTVLSEGLAEYSQIPLEGAFKHTVANDCQYIKHLKELVMHQLASEVGNLKASDSLSLEKMARLCRSFQALNMQRDSEAYSQLTEFMQQKTLNCAERAGTTEVSLYDAFCVSIFGQILHGETVKNGLNQHAHSAYIKPLPFPAPCTDETRVNNLGNFSALAQHFNSMVRSQEGSQGLLCLTGYESIKQALPALIDDFNRRLGQQSFDLKEREQYQSTLVTLTLACITMAKKRGEQKLEDDFKEKFNAIRAFKPMRS